MAKRMFDRIMGFLQKPGIEEIAMWKLETWTPCTTTRISDLYPEERWLLDNGYLKTRDVPGFTWLERTDKPAPKSS